MLKRYRSAAAGLCGLIATSAICFAAGNYSMYPLVGGATICAGTVTGSSTFGGNTGQGQATNGSICPLNVPAGPSIVTGTEMIPADTGLAGGAPPQTVVIPMAALNALPITVFTAALGAQNTVTAAATSGGYIFHATAGISAVTINLPPVPIDGQQFAVSADQTITTLVVTPTVGTGQNVKQMPTVLTVSTTAPYGYRFEYNLALLQWTRLQ